MFFEPVFLTARYFLKFYNLKCHCNYAMIIGVTTCSIQIEGSKPEGVISTHGTLITPCPQNVTACAELKTFEGSLQCVFLFCLFGTTFLQHVHLVQCCDAEHTKHVQLDCVFVFSHDHGEINYIYYVL